MNKYVPFIFPVIALAIIAFLTWRWYGLNTAPKPGQVSEFGQGVEIENLSPIDQQNILRGVGDYQSVELKGEGEAVGQVRYEIKDNKVNLSVSALLPELPVGVYQVWFKGVTGESIRKAFTLEAGKGGFIGSAAVPAELLPFQVVVSQETNVADNTMEQTLLQGTIQAE